MLPCCNSSLLIILSLALQMVSALLQFWLADLAHSWLSSLWVAVVPFCNSSLLMLSLPLHLPYLLDQSACKFVLFSNLFIFPTLFSQIVNVFYVSIQQNSHFLKDKAYYITPYHQKCDIFHLSASFFFSDLWYYFNLLIKAYHQQV